MKKCLVARTNAYQPEWREKERLSARCMVCVFNARARVCVCMFNTCPVDTQDTQIIRILNFVNYHGLALEGAK